MISPVGNITPPFDALMVILDVPCLSRAFSTGLAGSSGRVDDDGIFRQGGLQGCGTVSRLGSPLGGGDELETGSDCGNTTLEVADVVRRSMGLQELQQSIYSTLAAVSLLSLL